MLLKTQYGLQCLVLFLMLQFQASRTNAAASYAQFKREQQTTQQNKNQQLPQPLQQHQAQTQAAAIHGAQNMQEKDAMQVMMKHHGATSDASDLFGDPYQMMNELKHAEAQAPSASTAAAAATQSMPWNPNPFLSQANNGQIPMPMPPFGQSHFPYSPYNAATTMPFSSFGASPNIMETPKFFPFIGFPQPMFIPLPLFYPPTPAEPLIYSMYPPGMNNFEDAMSRGVGGRRTASHARDSPIYYMRLPPTPYMFLPNFGYTPTPLFSAYQPVSAFSGLSPTFNLPLSFMANGKPSGIYQMTSPPPNDFQNSYIGINNFNARPALQSNAFNGNYQSPMPIQDSRMTLLKQPFIFNGRPDEMYILQNSFNPMFGGI